MFFGTHPLRMDEKGRVALPARYRERLVDGLVVAKGQERCIAVYPTAYFREKSELLLRAPGTSPRVRDYQRLLFASADDPVPDKQGRITLREELRTYAALDRDCMAIGANSHVELWNREAWASFLSAREAQFAELEEEVVPGIL